MNFYFGMGGTPISLRQKLRMQRERMQCASLWPVVLNVLNSYFLFICFSVLRRYLRSYLLQQLWKPLQKQLRRTSHIFPVSMQQ